MLEREAEMGTRPHEDSDGGDDGLLALALALTAAASSKALARWVLWLKMAVAEAVNAWVRAVWLIEERMMKVGLGG